MGKPEIGKWYSVWEDDLPVPDIKNPDAKRDGYTRSKEVLLLDHKNNKFSAYCMCSNHEIIRKGKHVSWETPKGKFIEIGDIDHWMPLPVDPAPLRYYFDEKIAGQEVEIKYKEDFFRPVIDGQIMALVPYKEGVDFYHQLYNIVSKINLPVIVIINEVRLTIV